MSAPSPTPNPAPHPLVREARRVLEHARLRGAALLVAVSGGPDSTALLHALARLRTPLGLRLHVAHVDHGLRPTSGEDARRVGAMSEALGLPCTVTQVEVSRRGARGRRLSPEEAARDARYAVLARTATDVGADAVALGHTADDQAETVLLHVVRGSGLNGLQGMAPASTRDVDSRALTLVRPLLGVRRSETLAYCSSLGATPVWDETNLDPAPPRNRLRLEAFPTLARINPNVTDALNRLAQSAGRDLDYVREQAERLWPAVARAVEGGVRLDRAAVNALHPALQRHVLRDAYTRARGDARDLADAHVEQMARLLSGPSGRGLDLPGGVRLEAAYDDMTLLRGEASPCAGPPLSGQHALTVPGETVVPGWRVLARIEPTPEGWDAGPRAAFLSADALGGPVVVRGRKPGDRFQPLGLVGHDKKLQDFFVDARVPRAERPRTPLVVTPKGIAWVVGWRIAHWARVTPEMRCVVRLDFRAESP